MNNIGISYIAANEPWLSEVLHSAKSVKKHCKDINTTLFTNKIVKSAYIDSVNVDKNMKGTRFKFNYLDKFTYEYNLYLDSDTEVRFDIKEIFSILDKFDIALCHCICRISDIEYLRVNDYSKIPRSFCEFNGGLMLFRKTDAVKKFIKLWKHLYYKYEKDFGFSKDQLSLRVALWNSDLKIYTLPIEYNLQHINKIQSRYKDIKPMIIHGRKLYSKPKLWKKKHFRMASK
jgi:hypothetical protein